MFWQYKHFTSPKIHHLHRKAGWWQHHALRLQGSRLLPAGLVKIDGKKHREILEDYLVQSVRERQLSGDPENMANFSQIQEAGHS